MILKPYGSNVPYINALFVLKAQGPFSLSSTISCFQSIYNLSLFI